MAAPDPKWEVGVGEPNPGHPLCCKGATQMQHPRMWVQVMREVPQLTCVTLEKSFFF